MDIVNSAAHTSSNNMLTNSGLLDRGVLLASTEKVSEDFLKEIDIEKLFAVDNQPSPAE